MHKHFVQWLRTEIEQEREIRLTGRIGGTLGSYRGLLGLS